MRDRDRIVDPTFWQRSRSDRRSLFFGIVQCTVSAEYSRENLTSISSTNYRMTSQQSQVKTTVFIFFLLGVLLFFLKKFNFSCFVLTRVCLCLTVYGWLITGLLNFGHSLSQLFSDSFKNHLIIHTLIDFLSLINLQKDCTFLSLTNYLVFTTHKKFYEWNYVRWTNFSNNFFLTFLTADSQFLSQ